MMILTQAAPTTTPGLFYFLDAADTDEDGVLSAAERAAATPVTYAAATPPVVAPDERIFVFIRQDIPETGLADGDDAGFVLSADTRDAVTFADVVADANGTNDANALLVENVLADLAGDASGDIAEDGTHSDSGFFVVQNPNVTATKEVFGVSSSLDGTCDAITASASYAKPTASTEYFTPGSCVEYVIEVTNDGVNDATDIVLTDNLPANLTFREAALRGDLVALPADLSAPTAGTVCDGPSGGACTVSVTDGTVAAPNVGDPATVGYLVIRATID